MKFEPLYSFTLCCFVPIALGSTIPRSASVEFLGPFSVEANGLQNIHVAYNRPIDGDLSLYYGGCSPSSGGRKLAHHHIGMTRIGTKAFAKRNLDWYDARPEKFVWVVPENAPNSGCLHAYVDGDELVGVSKPINVLAKKSRRGIAIADYVDAEGPWFDGVEYISAKEPGESFVAKAKNSTIGILGGGMSGLMSAVSLRYL